ncbi:MAG TPA: Fur family transcriptional regulator [Gaiellaceae bacterium]|nr:Fur family transcriptional regulator [Gaiellaceae bacterium]
MNDWAEATLGALRRRGRRSGAARTAVVDLLGRQTCCVTAQEIYDRLRDERKPVGLASIYRTLDQLSSDGFVQKIELGSGITRYEPVRLDGEHHHHLVCDDCGKVEAFADDRLERAIHRVETETGYRVAAHDVVLRGACGDCR